MRDPVASSRAFLWHRLTTRQSRLAAASIVLLSFVPGSVFGQATTVLLLPPLASDVSSETARLVEESLGNVLTQQGDRVVRLSDLDSDESARVVSGECQGLCLVQLLERSGGDRLIQPRISRSGQGYIVQLQFLTSDDGESLVAVDGQEPVVVWLPNEGPGTVHGRLARALSETRASTESERQSQPTPVAVAGGYVVAVQGSEAILRIVPDPPDSEVAVQQEPFGGEGGVTRVHITVRRSGFESAHLLLHPGGSGEQTIEVTLTELPNQEDAHAVSSCTAVGALWRSAILPGWGQYCKGQTLRAGLFFGGFLLSSYNYQNSIERYRSALDDFRTENLVYRSSLAVAASSMVSSVNDPAYSVAFYSASDVLLSLADRSYLEARLDFDCPLATCDRAQEARDDRDRAPYLIGLVYIWNLLDAYFASGAAADSGNASVRAETAEYDFSLAPEPDGGQRMRLGIHWRF